MAATPEGAGNAVNWNVIRSYPGWLAALTSRRTSRPPGIDPDDLLQTSLPSSLEEAEGVGAGLADSVTADVRPAAGDGDAAADGVGKGVEGAGEPAEIGRASCRE